MEFFLQTDRLGLRKLTLEDVELVRSVLQDEEIMFFSASGVKSDEEIMDYITQSISDYEDGYGQYAVYEKNSAVFIGLAGYFSFLYEEHQDLEISYRLLRDYWGRGYASEIARALTRFALGELGYEWVFGLVDQRNVASQKVLENAGMKQMGEFCYHGRNTLLYSCQKE